MHETLRWRLQDDTVVPALITLVGLGLVFVVPFQLWVFDGPGGPPGPAQLLPVLLANVFPALGLAYGGRWLVRTDIDANRYLRIGSWCFGGLFVLLGINVAVMFAFPPGSLGMAVGWAQGVAVIGSVGGFAVGVVEARAIERAREAERARIETSRVKQERERLDYLNTLLRHEVLNDANVITGNATTLLDRTDLDEDVRSRVELIERRSKDLAGLIDNARILVAATQGQKLEPVRLAPVVRDEVTAIRAERERVDVELSIPEDVEVLADDLLGRVFHNLLSNAIEHHDGDVPTIAIAAEQSAESVRVRVADDGPGIPENERDTLFELADPADAHGLGLYIVRTLLDRYGGSIDLTERGLDGSVFTVGLRRPRAVDDGGSNRAVERN